MLPETVSVALLSQTGDVLISWYSHERHDRNEVRTSSLYTFTFKCIFTYTKRVYSISSVQRTRTTWKGPINFLFLKWNDITCCYCVIWIDLYFEDTRFESRSVILTTFLFSWCSSFSPIECSGNASKSFTHLIWCLVTEHD